VRNLSQLGPIGGDFGQFANSSLQFVFWQDSAEIWLRRKSVQLDALV
jgi:hypothetical protein